LLKPSQADESATTDARAIQAAGLEENPGRRTASATPSDLDVRRLAERLGEAFAARDLAAIGAVATLSAEADQAANPKPHWAELRALAAATGALGVAVSHSGSAVALLFAPDAAQDARRARDALREIGLTRPALFRPFG
jgi:uncharacterized protein involved in propanediol utilization